MVAFQYFVGFCETNMAKQQPKIVSTVKEVLKILEGDAGSVVCPKASSSDKEDLVHLVQ